MEMGCGTTTWCGQAEQKRHRRKSANEAENCLILLTRQASTKNAAPPRIPRPGQGSRREGEGGRGGRAVLLTGQTCQSRQLLTEGVAAHNYADGRQYEAEAEAEADRDADADAAGGEGGVAGAGG